MKILIPFSIIILFLNCGKKDWRDDLAESNAKFEKELAQDHAVLKSFQKEHYSIPNSANSKEKAIQNYLQDLAKHTPGEEAKHALNKQELREILYPNSLGIGTSLDKTRLADYEKLIWERRKLGEERILGKWTAGSKVVKIHWQENPRTYGALTGHKPESIEISTNGKKLNLSQIKQVIEHKGQFKVAVVAP